MNPSLFALTSNLVSITSVIAAAVLALHDKAGWSWFLLLALLTSVIVNHKK